MPARPPHRDVPGRPAAAVRASDVERELARARGARRLLPWSLLTAAGGALIPLVAGGGAPAAASLAAVGLLFALFLGATSVARCPACGARLRVRLKERPSPRTGPARVEVPASCPACRTRFE